ncbi:MAG: FimV family protein [Succinivibrionaceae bacterium]
MNLKLLVSTMCCSFYMLSLLANAEELGGDFSVDITHGAIKEIEKGDYKRRLTIATSVIKENDPLLSEAQNKCGIEPILPPDIEIPTPKVPRFSLDAEYSRYTIKSGDVLSKIVKNVRPTGTEEKLTDEQILAAIVRANPKAFSKVGGIAGKEIIVPSIQRMELEASSTGREIYKYAGESNLQGVHLPLLAYPWAEEDAKIAKKTREKKERDLKVEEIVSSYEKCIFDVQKNYQEKLRAEELAKEKLAKEQAEKEVALLEEQKKKELEATTEADLSEFMIPEEPEKLPPNVKIVNGKKVIVLTDKSKKVENLKEVNSDNDSNNIIGSSLVLGSDKVIAKDSNGKELSKLDLSNDKSSKNSTNTTNPNYSDLDKDIIAKLYDLEDRMAILSSKMDTIISIQQHLLNNGLQANPIIDLPHEKNSGWSFSSILCVVLSFILVILLVIQSVFYINRNYFLKSSLEKYSIFKFVLNHKIFVYIKLSIRKLRNFIKVKMEDADNKEDEDDARVKEEFINGEKEANIQVLTKMTTIKKNANKDNDLASTTSDKKAKESIHEKVEESVIQKQADSNTMKTFSESLVEPIYSDKNSVEILLKPVAEIEEPEAHIKSTFNDSIGVSEISPEPSSIEQHPIDLEVKNLK